MSTDETIVITGEDVMAYDLLSFRSALGLEIESARRAKLTGGTPMVVRAGVSVVRQAIKRGYVPEGTRTKLDAYASLDALCVAIGAQSKPIDGASDREVVVAVSYGTEIHLYPMDRYAEASSVATVAVGANRDTYVTLVWADDWPAIRFRIEAIDDGEPVEIIDHRP